MAAGGDEITAYGLCPWVIMRLPYFLYSHNRNSVKHGLRVNPLEACREWIPRLLL